MKTENKIQAISDLEAEKLPRMCEIRFDCLVTMFEMAQREVTVNSGFFVKEERQLKPQWFKSQYKITLDEIKNCDEYVIGVRLKEMLYQLEKHIEKYETGYL